VEAATKSQSQGDPKPEVRILLQKVTKLFTKFPLAPSDGEGRVRRTVLVQLAPHQSDLLRCRAMPNGQNEAFSRILIDKALEFSGWNLLDPHAVRFELNGGSLGCGARTTEGVTSL
jgi:hypothetical protein